MDKTIAKAITDYIKLISQNYPNLETAYLFGSYAGGNPSQNSDIDIAVVLKDLHDGGRFDVQVKLMLLAAQVDTRIEPHPVSQKDFSRDSPFSKEIKRTGFKISDGISPADLTRI